MQAIIGFSAWVRFPFFLPPAAWEVWTSQANTSGGKEESGGEKKGARGGDECLQQAEGGSWNTTVSEPASHFTAATEER